MDHPTHCGAVLPLPHGVYVCAQSLSHVWLFETPQTVAHPSTWDSVHGILQARILEWVAVPSSRESFRPRDWTWVSSIAGKFFTIWATREAVLETIIFKGRYRHYLLIYRCEKWTEILSDLLNVTEVVNMEVKTEVKWFSPWSSHH